MKKSIVSILGVLAIAIILNGCLPDEAPLPKRISLTFNVGETGDTITRGDDSIVVNEIKILLDGFTLFTSGEASLETRLNALVLRYRTSNNGNDEQIIAGNLGFSDINNFNGVEFNVEPAEGTDNLGDLDLFQNGEGFSIFFTGTYNGNNFEYRSDATFSRLFNFSSNVELNETEETIFIRVSSSISDFLVNAGTDQIISPVDGKNAMIDNQIQQSLQVEASAEQSIPFN